MKKYPKIPIDKAFHIRNIMGNLYIEKMKRLEDKWTAFAKEKRDEILLINFKNTDDLNLGVDENGYVHVIEEKSN